MHELATATAARDRAFEQALAPCRPALRVAVSPAVAGVSHEVARAGHLFRAGVLRAGGRISAYPPAGL